jgi:hypothetical protein
MTPEEKETHDDVKSGQSSEPLLSDSDSDFTYRPRKSTRWSWCSQLPLYAHVILVLIYTSVYVTLYLSTLYSDNDRVGSSQRLPLPDRQGLIWEQRKFPTSIVDNPLTGDPRPEMDEAWHHLLRNDNIRVPKEYLDERNLTSVYTKDGTEGIASLSVYHSLHCLVCTLHSCQR